MTQKKNSSFTPLRVRSYQKRKHADKEGKKEENEK